MAPIFPTPYTKPFNPLHQPPPRKPKKKNNTQELDWTPKYGNLEGFVDSYQNDFLVKQAAGSLKFDYECDDMVLKVRFGSLLFAHLGIRVCVFPCAKKYEYEIGASSTTFPLLPTRNHQNHQGAPVKA